MKKQRERLSDEALLQRRMKFIRAADGSACHEWTGAIRKDGYGAFWDGATSSPAHRLIFEAVHGIRLKRFEFVCHSCDNRKCVNPEHLWLGSPLDNTRDMDQKGRRVITEKLRDVLRNKDAKGEANNRAKLSNDAVKEIMHSDESAGDLAAKFGVTRHHIYRIRWGIRWSHVGDAR